MIIEDGFGTTVILALVPTAALCVKTVTPPEVDGRGGIDTTCMDNDFFVTQVPKTLVKVGNTMLKVAYDPAYYVDIIATINTIQLINVTFADGSFIEFLGWVNKFKPDEIKEGEEPMAEIEICASMEDDSQVEGELAFTAA